MCGGDSVMSKSPTGQANEVLCKVLAHNLVCVAQAAIEYGVGVHSCLAKGPTTVEVPGRVPAR